MRIMVRRKIKGANSPKLKGAKYHFSPANGSQLTEQQKLMLERRAKIGLELAENPSKVYNTPALRQRLFALMPEEERQRHLTAIARTKLTKAMRAGELPQVRGVWSLNEKRFEGILTALSKVKEEELLHLINVVEINSKERNHSESVAKFLFRIEKEASMKQKPQRDLF